MHETLNAPITGSVAWLGREIASSTEWIRPFAGREIDEIDAALRGIQRRGLGWPTFGRDEFPLPTFARVLRAVLDELEDGRGFVLPGMPPLTAAQNEALDLHAAVCEELCLTMALEPGDWPLLNNHVIHHGRTHYEDADGADQDRLLLRLWLATPNSRALPPSYLPIWGTTAPGAPRGGIAQPAASA